MSGARGEGAVIDPVARTVRLRHEPRGFHYELSGDERAVEVLRVDEIKGTREAYGNLRLVKGRWRAANGDDKRKMDSLLLVARAWNYVPLLKGGKAPALDGSALSQPAPPSGTRVIDGAEAPSLPESAHDRFAR